MTLLALNNWALNYYKLTKNSDLTAYACKLIWAVTVLMSYSDHFWLHECILNNEISRYNWAIAQP